MKKNTLWKTLIAVSLLPTMLFSAVGCKDDGEEDAAIKNIVLIIGDGMGLEHITAGELFEGKEYAFTDWTFTSVNTDSVNAIGKGPELTDSAASGTALATGNLTVNGYVGKSYYGEDVETILDYAKSKGKATGVVTTDYLSGATPSAFSAHAMSRENTQDIITSQLSSGVTLLCGTTQDPEDYAAPENDIQAAGYTLCNDYSAIETAKQAEKAYWQFDMAGMNASVKLEDVAEDALEYLSKDEDGFVVMIEQAHVDKYSHDNVFNGMIESVASLNRTVERVISWIGNRKDTAVLITADHETGGLTVSTEARYQSSYRALTGDMIYYNFSSRDHTNSKVGLFVHGITPDYSDFSYYKSNHLIKNSEVFMLMQKVLTDPTVY